MNEDEKKDVTVNETGSASGDTTKEATTQNADTSTAKDESKDGKRRDETKSEEKSFTQAELDRVVAERLQRERNKMPSKEELATFQKWKDDQKTAEQLQADELSEAKRTAAEAQAELAKLRQLDAIRKAGVDEKFASYVNYEVTELAKAKNVGFDEALLLFLKDNADAYKKQEVRTVTVDTGAKATETKKAEEKSKLQRFF